ncbi:hypothetical protein [Bacteroides uniformis]|uniref:hypothetical protein n=1 Tax=Bacteroides uniformis TaxID=820 RepID=UPI0015F31CDB|nr:hypothetical protein [Bacteroides uniformis]MDC1768851.1 hypothetical protein [Bacteroides uniformis]MDC1773008.1 hypothetical protein [Bacteroides uniformis]MDC1775480.1 hypothetical protein [Bacteroides uniformis]MDC1779332.1 hypothetical protein [Bacteroides uniformis]MDC1783071.1 hypothetical protein [Bacteroides uniformis]
MEQTVQTRIIQTFLEDMQAIAQDQLHAYTHEKPPSLCTASAVCVLHEEKDCPS